MAQGNTVTVVGNITREPELRFLPSGAATCTFGLAVNERWMDKTTNEWVEETSFFNVICWREMAENAAESLPKGCRVIVNGKLKQRSWEDTDGNKKSLVEIVADEVGPSVRWATAEVHKVDRRNGGGDGGGGYDGGHDGGGRAQSNRQPAKAASAGRGRPAAPRPTRYDPEEEPF